MLGRRYFLKCSLVLCAAALLVFMHKNFRQEVEGKGTEIMGLDTSSEDQIKISQGNVALKQHVASVHETALRNNQQRFSSQISKIQNRSSALETFGAISEIVSVEATFEATHVGMSDEGKSMEISVIEGPLSTDTSPATLNSGAGADSSGSIIVAEGASTSAAEIEAMGRVGITQMVEAAEVLYGRDTNVTNDRYATTTVPALDIRTQAMAVSCRSMVYCPTCDSFSDAKEECEKRCKVDPLTKQPGEGKAWPCAAKAKDYHSIVFCKSYCEADTGVPHGPAPPTIRPHTRVVHVLNPVPFENKEQNMAFSSIEAAVTMARDMHGIEVTVVLADGPGDIYRPQRPASFETSDAILRTLINVVPFADKEKKGYIDFPLIADILRTANAFMPADYIVWTNADIGLINDFYVNAVLLAQVYHGVSLLRVPLRKFYSLQGAYGETRTSRKTHQGHDCIVFDSVLLNYMTAHLGNVFIGTGGVGQALLDTLECAVWTYFGSRDYPRMQKLNARLTFHDGPGGELSGWQKCMVTQQNEKYGRSVPHSQSCIAYKANLEFFSSLETSMLYGALDRCPAA